MDHNSACLLQLAKEIALPLFDLGMLWLLKTFDGSKYWDVATSFYAFLDIPKPVGILLNASLLINYMHPGFVGSVCFSYL